MSLNYLHSHPSVIIHRDIKPENLLFDNRGRVKLCDFGWSIASIDSSDGLQPQLPRTTFCGTFDYLSPEVILGLQQTTSLDCWSAGILLFEFLTGRTPFVKDGRNETYRRVLDVDISWPSGCDGNIDDEARDLITRFLKKVPSERITVTEALKHPFITRHTTQNPELLHSLFSEKESLKKENDFLRAEVELLKRTNGILRSEIDSNSILEANRLMKQHDVESVAYQISLQLREEAFKHRTDIKDSADQFQRWGLYCDKRRQIAEHRLSDVLYKLEKDSLRISELEAALAVSENRILLHTMASQKTEPVLNDETIDWSCLEAVVAKMHNAKDREFNPKPYDASSANIFGEEEATDYTMSYSLLHGKKHFVADQKQLFDNYIQLVLLKLKDLNERLSSSTFIDEINRKMPLITSSGIDTFTSGIDKTSNSLRDLFETCLSLKSELSLVKEDREVLSSLYNVTNTGDCE